MPYGTNIFTSLLPFHLLRPLRHSLSLPIMQFLTCIPCTGLYFHALNTVLSTGSLYYGVSGDTATCYARAAPSIGAKDRKLLQLPIQVLPESVSRPPGVCYWTIQRKACQRCMTGRQSPNFQRKSF